MFMEILTGVLVPYGYEALLLTTLLFTISAIAGMMILTK